MNKRRPEFPLLQLQDIKTSLNMLFHEYIPLIPKKRLGYFMKYFSDQEAQFLRIKERIIALMAENEKLREELFSKRQKKF